MNKLLFLLFSYASAIIAHADPYELGIISMFKNEAPYLREWVEYHLMAGVDHFWMFDNGSTDNWQDVLAPYIERGLIEVTPWPLLPTEHHWTETQVRAFAEGIKLSQGRAKWVAVIDIDEFILPMSPETIPQCLERNFANASAVYVSWLNFGTGKVWLNPGEPILFRLTACSDSAHPYDTTGKSIMRPDHVDVDKLWYIHFALLKPGYTYVNGNAEPLRFNGKTLLSGPHRSNSIRINHYAMRDENFLRNSRIAKALKGEGDVGAIRARNAHFSKCYDDTMIRYIMNMNPKSFWGEPPPSRKKR